jgi:lipoprotein-anchoring transpeptidase ErfK/SrfK
MAKKNVNVVQVKNIFGNVTDNGDVIKQMIATIGKASAKLDSMIQVAAVSACLHFVKCGDTVYMARLYEAASRSANRQSLAVWFQTNAAVKVQTKANESGEAIATFKKDSERFDKIAAMDQKEYASNLSILPWNAAVKEATFDGFDLPKRVAAALASAIKIMDGEADGKPADHAKNNFAGLAELKQWVAKYGTKKAA